MAGSQRHSADSTGTSLTYLNPVKAENLSCTCLNNVGPGSNEAMTVDMNNQSKIKLVSFYSVIILCHVVQL